MIKTVYELFADTAKRASDRAFLCYPPTFGRGYHEDGLEVTYAEALGKIDALAARYREAGYQPGHRIALAAANLPEHFWHYLALNSIGATAVTINPDYLPHEISFGIGFAECAMIVAAPQCLERAREGVRSLKTPIPVFDRSNPDTLIPPPALSPNDISPDAEDRIALIIYTSGTSGEPKGCLISN